MTGDALREIGQLVPGKKTAQTLASSPMVSPLVEAGNVAWLSFKVRHVARTNQLKATTRACSQTLAEPQTKTLPLERPTLDYKSNQLDSKCASQPGNCYSKKILHWLFTAPPRQAAHRPLLWLPAFTDGNPKTVAFACHDVLRNVSHGKNVLENSQSRSCAPKNRHVHQACCVNTRYIALCNARSRSISRGKKNPDSRIRSACLRPFSIHSSI